MTYETMVPKIHKAPHYHGDKVRALFLAGAVVLIIAESVGASLPVTVMQAVAIAVVLVIVGGITNPDQFGIHWFNGLLAAGGVLLFGTSAVEHYRAGYNIFDSSFLFTEALSILSLIALYYTTRTIRGIIQRPNLS